MALFAQTRQAPPPPPRTITAVCPSCNQRGKFSYLGEQCWPEAVALKLGISAVQTLWDCACCHSSVTEEDLTVA